ncbi:MAG: aspartate ammonia-lyase [Bacteroidota bacterium]
MNTTTTIQDFLKRIELFDGLNDSEIEIVISNAQEKSLKQEEMLFSEGEERQYIYLILDGEVELFKKNIHGGENRLALFHKFDFLGEGSLMDDYPHSTSARTTSASQVLIIQKDFFAKHGNIAVIVLSHVARIISRRMRQSNMRTVSASSQYLSGRTRTEHDLLGYREVPHEAYYGVQTLRAVENFNISGVTLSFFPTLINGLAMIKMASARANHDLGYLPDDITKAIEHACEEIINGKFHSHFVVDMIQGGAGTSTNMNANEVIANRAIEILGHERGEYKYCHPNNHVNLAQSTNDAYPSSVRMAIIFSNQKLIEVLKVLIDALRSKAIEYKDIIKMGRTQLQDAVPMTLGQSFNAYVTTLEEEIERLTENANLFLSVNMGGTAIGTGLNADPDYSAKVVEHLRIITGLDVSLAPNLVEATQDTGAFVMYSSALKRLAVKLSKMCNDLRLLSSGPRAGLYEIKLPPMQPGSSIMPGKVNPVIPEVVNQIAFKVIGNDITVTMAAEAGQLELNVMEPIIVHCIFESIEMLKNGMETLTHRCIEGIEANPEICRAFVNNSIGLVTALNPVLGYETSTALAKEALETGKGVYALVLEKNLLSKEALDDVLKPENMIAPRKMKK